jgi:peptide subunit release factor 1 (eRF1)
LQSKVLKLVDISYGGENGFNQAIELSTEVLSNVKFIQEKKLIGIGIGIIVCEMFLVCMGDTEKV